MKGLIHTCTIRGRHQNFTLGYDTGTAVFTAGKTLTGATSHATAVIVSTGSIASGSLQVHSVVGTFQDNETIADNGTAPGSAKVNGTIAEAFDINGELIYSDIDTAISCRFYNQKELVQESGSAPYYVTSLKVMIGSDSTPETEDVLISTSRGHEGTFTIGNVTAYDGAAGLHHWTCDIAKGGA